MPQDSLALLMDSTMAMLRDSLSRNTLSSWILPSSDLPSGADHRQLGDR